MVKVDQLDYLVLPSGEVIIPNPWRHQHPSRLLDKRGLGTIINLPD
jgi:hypothetical protein